MSFLVLCIFPKQEPKVADRISAIGYEPFFPRLKRLVVRRGHRCTDVQPMFPNYLIVKERPEDDRQLAVLCSTPGVSELLMTVNNTPARASDAEIAKIRARCTHDDILIVKKHTGFLIGENVRPTSGPFQNFVGRFDSEHAGFRVSALLNLFGREVKVSFKQGDLVAA